MKVKTIEIQKVKDENTRVTCKKDGKLLSITFTHQIFKLTLFY